MSNSSRYIPAAQAALRHYPLGPNQVHFVAHNAGAVFRVDALEAQRSYLLKLHVRVGEGYNAPVEGLELGMRWLAGIARDTGITVQTPLASSAGAFVCTIV